MRVVTDVSRLDARVAPPGRVFVANPSITEAEIALVAEAAGSGWRDRHDYYQRAFETCVAARVGRAHAVSTGSCTSALHLILAALGIGPGDEVVVPEITWIGTSSPLKLVGATPVFADVDPGTWCMSARTLEAAITPRTKAAIVVDLYGGVPDWDALSETADRLGITLIEDAAQAIGTSWRDRSSGSFGRASAFSFHGSKTITTGEGGMALTDDPELHERMLSLRDQGRRPGTSGLVCAEVGFKARMSAMQAAMGIAQMGRLDEIVAMKRAIFETYRAAFAGRPDIALNPEIEDASVSVWMSTIVLEPASGIERDALAAALARKGIDTRPIHPPLSAQPAYAGTEAARLAAARNTAAYEIARNGINLPSGPAASAAEILRVCEATLDALGPAVSSSPVPAKGARP